MLSSLNKSLFDAILNPKKPKRGSRNFICRDDLSKNPSRNKPKKGDFLVSNNNNNNFAEPLLCKGKEGGVIRVKVKMTKQEAARLMSKCKDSGILGFKDAAQELEQIPVNRVSVVPVSSRTSGYGYGCGGGVLKTIHEEI